ncbi:MAG TPA: nucleotide sugar dehydrogenase [Hyphomicrobium sp.]|nr:nucleotide sugar dehydrogenase [Hyphomicrobium sp.]
MEYGETRAWESYSNMSLYVSASDQHVESAAYESAQAIEVSKPSISVIGLGYVGAVSMACLSHLGFRMVGVDVSREKVDAIGEGRSPIVEDRLGDLLEEGVRNERITATQNLVAAVVDTDVTFLSVGTPTSKDGGCDFTFVRQASRAIGQAIAMKSGYHVVVLRCSVPPGTTLDVVVPEIETASGKKLGADFGVCFNPEFLREGVAVADFFAPPKTVVGASDKRAERTVTSIYEAVDKNVIFTSIESAEMVKYVDNVWHATKVAFGNEVGRLCKKLDIDSHDVMNIFVKDLKLNLSPYYLKPGFAYGGSCLPKEVRAVSHIAHAMGVDVPLIDSLGVSNQRHIAQAVELLRPFAGKRIGFLGVTFKPGTDDMRESPTLDVMATLLSAGETIRAYDPNLDFGPLLQHQIDYVRHAVPAQAKLMDELEAMTVKSAGELVAKSDVVVVSHATDEFRRAVTARNPDVHVLDLARLFKEIPADDTYQGIAW